MRLSVLGLAILMTLSSCVSSKKYDALAAEKDALAASLAESQEAIKKLEEENALLMQEKNNMSSEIATIKADLQATKGEIEKVKQQVAMKDAELQKIKTEVKSAFGDYEAAGLTVTTDENALYITMPEKVLFKSGSARLDKQDKEVLKKLADILVKSPDLMVTVEGHTDDQPIASGQYTDNWDLSVARAVAVTRELVKMGVKPDQVTASGAGEFSPAVTENPKSKETRQANRRTEFVLVPRVDKLYDLTK